jgi:hypothetical protein
MAPIPWHLLIPGAISLIGGAFGGSAKAKAQQRENIRAAEEENIRRRFDIDAGNLKTRYGIDERNIGVRGEIDSSTRRAAKLEDLAGMFRQFESDSMSRFSNLGAGIGVSAVDSPEARAMAEPTDRSIPAEMMMNVIPIAAIPMTTDCWTTWATASRVKMAESKKGVPTIRCSSSPNPAQTKASASRGPRLVVRRMSLGRKVRSR